MKYIKKPVIVEAIQWNGQNTKQILETLNYNSITIIFYKCRLNAGFFINLAMKKDCDFSQSLVFIGVPCRA